MQYFVYIDFFMVLFGESWVFVIGIDLYYVLDYMEDFVFLLDVVFKFEIIVEVFEIMCYCYVNYFIVILFGVCIGLSGGVLVNYGGVLFSFEWMNCIFFIDEYNYQVIIQLGVVMEEL